LRPRRRHPALDHRGAQTYADGLFEGMVREWVFPRGAVEFLERNPLPGRLFHVYAWGGYLLYRLPDRPVFIDGRAHTVYPAEFFREAGSGARRPG